MGFSFYIMDVLYILVNIDIVNILLNYIETHVAKRGLK